MHVKSDNLESFLIQKKGTCCSKKSKWGREKWVQEEGGDQENKKGSNKKGNEKRMKEKFDERKPQKRSKLDKNYKWKVIVRKNAFLEWKRIEKTKKRSFQKKTLFCQVSFGEKMLWRRIVKHKIFATFCQKWRIEICFFVEKINKNKNTKKRLQESTNKELHKKKKLHSQFHFVKDMF